jgi:hypothetical protein
MKRFKKILLSIIGLVVVLSVMAYVYLFVDPNKYPQINEQGLLTMTSASIPSGVAISVKDSISKNITVDGEWFKDAAGRVMNLRGINLGGSSKNPFTPRLSSHIKDGFFESANTVSFVGRPFPLTEADLHFKRLASWGFQFLRLVVTWEAIEHEGPGIYDQEYLSYLYELVKKAQAHDMNVFIDPHQDVWSRFTGGDGAPLWTLEKAGFDATKFSEAGAAIVHNVKGDPFPKMVWPTNETKLAATSMYTLFFAGNDFAPQLKTDSVAIQDYLQNHYINAILQVALKLKDLPNVIGFDTLNEPSAGYIGIQNLDSLGLVRIGEMPTYFQGMIAGAGNTIEVSEWKFDMGFKEVSRKEINNAEVKVWKEDAADIWQQHGVWKYDESKKPVLLKKNYFSNVRGRIVDFTTDYWKPFALKFARALHSIDSRWIMFAEPALFTKLPQFTSEESVNFVNAGHWYDGVTLLTKKNMDIVNADVDNASIIFGKRTVREYFNKYLGQLKAETAKTLGNNPTLIGEFGVPFDMDEGKSFKTGDFSSQEDAIDRSFLAMENNLLNYTLWNYTIDNDNTHGDQWNGEDLSVFSVSQQTQDGDLNSGGRALSAVIRPYPYKISGVPLQSFFNKDKVEYLARFTNDVNVKEPTEIFIPAYHYSTGFEVLITKGKLAYDREHSLLLYFAEGDGEHTVIVRKAKR